MDKYFLAFMESEDTLDKLVTEEFLKDNEEYLAEGKDFTMFEGFKIKPELEGRVEDETEKLFDKVVLKFPEDSLFEYLKANSSSTDGKLKKYILHETDDGYQLQKHLWNRLAGEGVSFDVSVRQDMQEMLMRELDDRYRNTFRILPNEIKVKMLKNLIKNLMTQKVGGKKQIGGTTTSGALENVELESRRSLQDERTLNSVLKNFTIRGQSAGLTQQKVMGYTNDEGEDIPPIDISNTQIKTGRVTNKEMQRWLRIIQSQKGAIKTRLTPIKSIIESRLRTGERIIHLEADYVIGKLSLKKLSRREAIYNYWERIGTEEYKNLQSAYDELRQDLSDLFQDRDIDKNLRKILTDFYNFKPDMENGSLNYVVELPQTEMKSFSEKQKPSVIHEKFMQEMELLNEKKDTIEQLTEEREVFGAGIGDDNTGAENPDIYATDKETGKQRDTREYDPTSGGAEKVTGRRIQDPVKQTEPHEGFHLPGTKDTPETFLEIDTKELTQLGLELEEMEDIKADPLFYHAFGKDSGPFKDVAVFERELNKIKRELLSATRIGETVTEIDVDDKIFDYIEELEDLVISEKTKFHLPISDTLKNFGIGDETEIDNKLKKIGDFLVMISQFFDTGSSLSRSASPSTARATGHASPSGKRKEIVRPMNEVFPGRKNRENFLKEIQEVGDSWSNFMDAMTEFYILPMNSKYRPFNDNIAATYKVDEKTNRVWAMLTSDKADDNAFFKFLALEASDKAQLINKEDFKKFNELMAFISQPDSGVDIGELRNLLNSSRKRVTWILSASKKGDIANEVKIEFGAYFHRILERNNQDSQDIFGKDSEEWFDMFNPDTVYPFEAMVHHIERNRESYSQAFGASEAMGGKDSLVGEFFNALDSLELLKTEYEQALMVVHDEIRKMMGKPIYFNTGKLDNYDHVTKALELVEEKYRIELTAYELDTIVKEMNSMKELSIKHGVPEDSVYFMKANFR